MDPCTCEPAAGGDRLTLWAVVVLDYSGRVITFTRRPPGLSADQFVDYVIAVFAPAMAVVPSLKVKLRYAHSMECLVKRNPEYTFPVLQTA
jgi:hypothetical protein